MKTVWTRMLAITLALGMMVAGNVAKGDYTFSYTDTTGNIAYGTLQTTALTSSPYTGLELVTGGTMTLTGTGDFSAYNGNYSLVSGGPSTSLAYTSDTGNSTYYDNLIFPLNNSSIDPNNSGVGGDGYLDNYGLLFSKGTGNNLVYMDIYFYIESYYLWAMPFTSSTGGFSSTGAGSLTLSQSTPEPSSYALMALGLCCLAGYVYRRRMAVVA